MRNQPFKTEAIVFPRSSSDNETYVLIDGKFYLPVDEKYQSSVMSELGKRYLTKSFAHFGNTTKIMLSDGREFFHPVPATHDTQVFSYSDCTFIPIDKFDEMIENIPLTGFYED